MKIPITSVVSCTGCVFVTAGSPETLYLYDKKQEQTGSWTPFAQTSPDGRWPYASNGGFMSAATYQNPKASVGYVTFADADGQLYAGAPTRGISGPLLTHPLPSPSDSRGRKQGASGEKLTSQSPPLLFWARLAAQLYLRSLATPQNYLMLFWISGAGELWRGQSDGFAAVTWENAGLPPGAFLVHTQPAASIGTTGSIEVFVVSAEGDLWQMWHTTATGVWSDWYLHGQPSD
jgi:hypothetical protein